VYAFLASDVSRSGRDGVSHGAGPRGSEKEGAYSCLCSFQLIETNHIFSFVPELCCTFADQS